VGLHQRLIPADICRQTLSLLVQKLLRLYSSQQDPSRVTAGDTYHPTTTHIGVKPLLAPYKVVDDLVIFWGHLLKLACFPNAFALRFTYPFARVPSTGTI